MTYKYNSSMLLQELYDDHGTPETTTDNYYYVASAMYDAAGRVTVRGLGNGLSQGFEYYAWNERLSVMKAAPTPTGHFAGVLREDQETLA